MHPLLERVRTGLTDLAWEVAMWALIAVVVLVLAACLYFFGFWYTFVGTSLVLIVAKVYSYDAAFAELKREVAAVKDLAKGSPTMRKVRASELKGGTFLFGAVRIYDIDTLSDGKIMVHPADPGADSPWFFDASDMVDVTDRSLLTYEGGYEKFSASMWSHMDLEVDDDGEVHKYPPVIRAVPAQDLEEGQYLFGGVLIGRADYVEGPLVMVESEEPNPDTWFFERAKLVEVTDRSLLDYDGGRDRFNAIMRDHLGDPKIPPPLRAIPAKELRAGMFIGGSSPVRGVDISDSGRVMADPTPGCGADSPWFFDAEDLVEVTNQSLHYYEGGQQLAAAAWGRGFSRIVDKLGSDTNAPD